MILEGSIVNQIEINGFSNEKEATEFSRKLKSSKTVFNLSKIDKTLNFAADEASWKMKDDYSLLYLFITEDSFPEEDIFSFAAMNENLNFQHLVISPSGTGLLIYISYSGGKQIERKEIPGGTALMLGDLIKGGYQ